MQLRGVRDEEASEEPPRRDLGERRDGRNSETETCRSLWERALKENREAKREVCRGMGWGSSEMRESH